MIKILIKDKFIYNNKMFQSKKIFFIILIITLINCLSFQKHDTRYKVTSSTLPESITKKLVISITNDNISFKGCNYNSANYSLKLKYFEMKDWIST
jgi:hypothetical protein